MPIFPNYRKFSKLIKSKRHSLTKIQKSPSSSSDSIDQKSNLTKQNPKLNTGKESILSSTKQASAQVDKAIKQCPKHL